VVSRRHQFRFFVDGAGEPGAQLPLAKVDARHADVLRIGEDDIVEVVDPTGAAWLARLTDGVAHVVSPLAVDSEPARIELVAGALVGGRFDELVDAAVQAGASLVVPFTTSRRDAERLGARRARLQRIARAAAKQSKRTAVPEVAEPIDADGLRALAPGIVVDPGAPQQLDEVVAASSAEEIRLLVGPAEGLEPELVEALANAGWQRGRLGPTILRSELAAPVAVAIAAMHAPPGAPGTPN
jgi:16S rRNA (uracil1498-N3)-methyltransferase